jgi:1-acyl-sn-glycerol-3-phosphate acyltransferase
MSEGNFDQNPISSKNGIIKGLENFAQKTNYKIAQTFIKATKETIWHGKFKVTGTENIPTKGAAIVAPNHPTFIDEPFLMAAINRSMRFIGRQDKESPPIVKIVYPLFGVIGVSRHMKGEAKRFFRQVDMAVKDRELICIFPEKLDQEEKTEGEAVGEFMPGVVYIAKKYGLPIIPVLVQGTLSVRPNNTTNIGEPIHVKPVEIVIGKPIPANEIQNPEQIRQAVIKLKSNPASATAEQ